VGRLTDRDFPIFFWLVIALSIIVGTLAEWLVEWAAGGLDAPIAYGLCIAIGFTVGWKGAAWWDARVLGKGR